MEGFIVIALVLILVIGLYIGSYVLNNNTKVPEGIEVPPGCEGCATTSCTLHSNPNPQEDCERKT